MSRRIAALTVAGLTALGLTARARQQPDPAVYDQDLARLAIEASTRPKVDPIPLTDEHGHVAGAIYDRFLLGVLLAQAAHAAGHPIDIAAIEDSPAWTAHQMMLVAYPLSCDGKSDAPVAIQFTPSASVPGPPPDAAPPVRGRAAASLLPGVDLPADALVVAAPLLPLLNAEVAIDYTTGCHGSAHATFPITWTPSSAMQGLNAIALPAGSTAPSPTTVRIQAMIDLDGRARLMTPLPLAAPAELAAAAQTALGAHTFTPQLLNGVPEPVMAWAIPVVFTTTGSPDVIAPLPTAPVAPPERSPTTPVAPSTAPAPPSATQADMARLAIEVGTAGPARPLPLDQDGSRTHGLFFDRFLMQVVMAHAAAVAGAPLTPESEPPGFASPNALVVAVPLNCGHPVAPTAIALVSGSTPSATAGTLLTGAALRGLLPGVDLPPGSVGQAFGSVIARRGLTVTITYAEPACPASTSAVTLPVAFENGTSTEPAPPATIPETVSLPAATTVHVQAILDLTGQLRYAHAVDGPPELASAAEANAAQWRFRPFLLNTAPVPEAMTIDVSFDPPGLARASEAAGEPAPALSPFGRGSRNATTLDVAGLEVATSKCGVASADDYGRTPNTPIHVGGGQRFGPSHTQQFLAALRGPTGQGLHLTWMGYLRSFDRRAPTIDVYEVRYTGLAKTVRLYFDESHPDTLQAPAGFVCMAPLDLKDIR